MGISKEWNRNYKIDIDLCTSNWVIEELGILNQDYFLPYKHYDHKA